MKRRAAIAAAGSALATGLAGCLQDAPSASPEDPSEIDDTPTDDDPPDDDPAFRRYVSIADIDPVPEELPVSFAVRTIDARITPDRTARLEVAATNEGETERQIETPFYKGASVDEEGVLLYSVEAPDRPDEPYAPGCIDDPSPTQDLLEFTEEGPVTHSLDPDETGRDELLVVDDPTVEGCFPPGAYRFEREHAIDDETVVWGFTLDVAEEPFDDVPPEDDPPDVDPDDRRYEECGREVVPYDEFPEEIRTEIEAALDGKHEADRVYLREAIDTTTSYVSVDGDYYEPIVTIEDDRETLELRLVDPKALPSPRPVLVGHDRDHDMRASVEIRAEDGSVLLEEARPLPPGEGVPFGQIRRVGDHELSIVFSNGERIETTESVRINESRFDVMVLLDGDDVLVGGTVAELVPCRFE